MVGGGGRETRTGAEDVEGGEAGVDDLRGLEGRCGGEGGRYHADGEVGFDVGDLGGGGLEERES